MISITKLPRVLEGRSRGFYLLIAILSVWLISLIDYLTGPHVTMSLCYLFPIVITVWFVGNFYGYAIAALSTMAWMIADLHAGAHYLHRGTLYWDGVTRLWVFFVIVWLMARLQELQVGLEKIVADRTASLRSEIARREQLERELLHSADREAERIGRELHDGMGQHLAAAVAMSISLEQQCGQNHAMKAAVEKITASVKQAVLESRLMARGLNPAVLELGGLSEALEHLCEGVRAAHGVDCRFVCLQPVIIKAREPALHLFRIAQEAVTNAVRHARPRQVMVFLTREADRLTLIVQDDGMGLPPENARRDGTGLHIMAHRARLIGATLAVDSEPAGGTLVACALPLKQTNTDTDKGTVSHG